MKLDCALRKSGLAAWLGDGACAGWLGGGGRAVLFSLATATARHMAARKSVRHAVRCPGVRPPLALGIIACRRKATY